MFTSVTEELIAKALEVIKGAGVSKSITSASGYAGYDLQPIASVLQPVITKWRNRFPRFLAPTGANAAEWRYIANLITAGVTDATPTSEGAKGPAINYTVTPATAAFREVSLSDSVTFKAIKSAIGFENSLKAKAQTNLLFALMMVEEQLLGFDRLTNLGAVTAPTCASATSGGAIVDGTYLVKVRAITGTGDNTTTRGRISSNGTTGAISGGTGTANIIYAYTDWVEGAIAYEWYVNNGQGGATYYWQKTTGVNCVKLTEAIVTTGTAPNIAAPADNVTNALGMNGLIAQLTAANGAYVKTLDVDTATGVGTDYGLDDIDAANKYVWDRSKAQPETLYMNSTQRARLTKLWRAANGGPTTFVQTNSPDQSGLRAGNLVSEIVNVATGAIQKVETHPYLPDGTMVALSETIPFPTNGDQVAIDVEVQQEYMSQDYALTANKYDFGVFAIEALRVKFTGGCWVLRNIKSNANA